MGMTESLEVSRKKGTMKVKKRYMRHEESEGKEKKWKSKVRKRYRL